MSGLSMSIMASMPRMPAVAIGTLSGTLSPGAGTTTAAAATGDVGQAESANASGSDLGLTFTPYKAMQINSAGATLSYTPEQLSVLQSRFDQQVQSADQSGGG